MLPKSKSKSRSKRARGKQSSASPSSPALSKQPQSKKHGKKKKKKRRKASCGNVAGSKLLDPWHDEGIFRTRMMAFVFDPVVPELEVEVKRRISFSGSKLGEKANKAAHLLPFAFQVDHVEDHPQEGHPASLDKRIASRRRRRASKLAGRRARLCRSASGSRFRFLATFLFLSPCAAPWPRNKPQRPGRQGGGRRAMAKGGLGALRCAVRQQTAVRPTQATVRPTPAGPATPGLSRTGLRELRPLWYSPLACQSSPKSAQPTKGQSMIFWPTSFPCSEGPDELIP